MKIDSIYIDGFGIFHQQSIARLDRSPLSLILGNNEAGKSTLLGFIRTILFGFPRANAREPHYPALTGGNLGGRLTLTSANGESFIVERRPGKRIEGQLTLTTPSGDLGPDDLLLRLLGGVTADVFKSIYAFSLTELQAFETLHSDNVKNAIYSAVVGTADLPAAVAYLDQRLNLLFKPRGQKQAINGKLAEYDEVKDKLRDAIRTAADFDQQWQQYKEDEIRCQRLNETIRQLTMDRTRCDNYLRMWNDWLDYQECEQQLKGLPEVGTFPPDGVTRVAKDQEDMATLQKQDDEASDELAQLDRQIAGLSIDARLLGHAQEAEILIADVSLYREKRDLLPNRNRELTDISRKIQLLLERLGKDWTEERALSIDRSLFTHERIRTYQKQLQDHASRFESARQAVAAADTQYQDAWQEETAAGKAVAEFGPHEPEPDEPMVLKLHQGRDEYAGVIRDIPKRESEELAKQKSLRQLLLDIDPSWDEERLNSFDLSLAARRRVEEFARNYDARVQDQRQKETDIQNVRRSVDEARKKQERCLAALEAEPKPTVASANELEKRRAEIAALRHHWDDRERTAIEIENRKQRLADLTRQAERYNVDRVRADLDATGKAAGVSVAVAVLALLLLLPLGWRLIGANTAVIALVVATGFWISRRRYERQRREYLAYRAQIDEQIGETNNNIEKIQEKLSGLADTIAHCAATLAIAEPITAELLTQLDTLLQTDSQRLSRCDRHRELLNSLNDDVRNLEEKLEQAKKEFQRVESSLSTLDEQWKNQLHALRLAPDLTPSVVLLIFGKVETARQQVAAVRETQERLKEMRTVQAAYCELARQIPALAFLSQGSPENLLQEVDRYHTELRYIRQRNRERDSAAGTLAEKKTVVAKCKSALERHQEELRTAETELRNSSRQWQQWLAGNGFPATLSPETALDALQIITELVTGISQKGEMADTIDSLKQEIVDYETKLRQLLHDLGRLPVEPEQVAVVVNNLKEEIEQSKSNRRRRADHAGSAAKLRQKIETIRRDVDKRQTHLASLLTEAGVGTLDEFTERGRMVAQREEITAKMRTCDKTIRTVAGVADSEEIRRQLGTLTRHELESQARVLTDRVDTTEREREEMRTRLAERKHTIATMQTADTVANLRLAEERLLAEIRAYASEWTRYALAKYLIDQARQKFEREQQPRVLRDAGDFFRTITCNRYSELVAPLEKNTIEVITPANERKSVEVLSRGTAEQLYLSIRFGYIRNRAATNEPLPVIMDDILVNFDPHRARLAAEAIVDLSASHQILYFTCHPQTIEIFRDISPAVPCYELQDGRICAVS